MGVPLSLSPPVLTSFTDPFPFPFLTFPINGSYTQSPAGTLDLKIGGVGAGEFDRLVISGMASLSGPMKVNLVAGYWPNGGDRFKAVTFFSRSGTFASINGLNLGGGLTLTPAFTTTDFTLLTVSSPIELLKLFGVPTDNGQFRLIFNGQPGVSYQLKASTDLVSWVTLTTTSTPTGVIEFLDTEAQTRLQRFYRVVLP